MNSLSWIDVAAQLTPTDIVILRHLRNAGVCTRDALATAVEKSVETITLRTAHLEGLGFIRRARIVVPGQRRRIGWQIVEQVTTPGTAAINMEL